MSRQQLAALGITDDAIAARARAGWLIRLRPGVYSLGHRRDSRARHWAALLAVGDDGVLSHFAAAAEQGLIRSSPSVIDVTSPRRLSPRPGIRAHARQLDPAEIRHLDGLPLTSPAQTLFDLTTLLSADRLARVANEAFVQRVCEIGDLRATLERNGRRKGAAAFRRLLAVLDPDGHRVRSPLEIRVHHFLRARGYPPWESNVRLLVGGERIEPDVLWRAQLVIVEADGRDPHLAPLTFDSDRRRDRRLRVEGWEPVRVTSTDLDERPDELDDDLRALLALPPRQ